MKKRIPDIIFFVGVGLAIVSVIKVFQWDNGRKKLQAAQWKDTSCPSLLSIGRSSRDTLIVMKVEPLCNQYVLDNMK